MTDDSKLKQRLDLLDATLETYGGDRGRWPSDARAALELLLSTHAEAQRRLAAAEALDRVLSFAPVLSPAQISELSQRISAAAVHQAQTSVVQEDHARVRMAVPATGRIARMRNHGLAAAALAASLVLGVFSGQSTAVSAFADAVVGDAAGASTQVGRQLAMGDEADTILDEDLL